MYTTGLTTFAGDLECNNLNVNDNILSTPLDAVNDATYSSVSFPSTFSLSPYNGTETGSFIITGESTQGYRVLITLQKSIYNSTPAFDPVYALSEHTMYIVIKDSVGTTYYTSETKSASIGFNCYLGIDYALPAIIERTTPLYGDPAGKTYYVWAYMTINVTGDGSIGVKYSELSASTASFTDYCPNNSASSGYILSDNIISNSIFSSNIAGVFGYNSAWCPVTHTVANLTNWTGQSDTTSELTNADRQDETLSKFQTGTAKYNTSVIFRC